LRPARGDTSTITIEQHNNYTVQSAIRWLHCSIFPSILTYTVEGCGHKITIVFKFKGLTLWSWGERRDMFACFRFIWVCWLC